MIPITPIPRTTSGWCIASNSFCSSSELGLEELVSIVSVKLVVARMLVIVALTALTKVLLSTSLTTLVVVPLTVLIKVLLMMPDVVKVVLLLSDHRNMLSIGRLSLEMLRFDGDKSELDSECEA